MTTFNDSDPRVADERETTEGKVFTVQGNDWDELLHDLSSTPPQERIIVNMGPQHPSTHGVLRLILELDGETVTEARCGIGYLHTGIEKNMEFRTWTQGVTFVTRMDYLSPFFNETAYCLGVEKLLGITDQIPERANVIRVMMMELNRISSHLVCLATGGMELGALTAMIFGFRERELVLDVFEMITGLRMNHAYIRPGGLAQDLPEGADGTGNSFEHIRQIMGTSMEALIHHFKLVTEGFKVPAGQVYAAIESPRGELGVHLVSDGGTRPYRVHFRDPSFTNLQATAAMCEGAQIADVVAAVASIDPVMGGVDR